MRSLIAAGLFACGISWTVQRQFGVEEIHLVESPRHIPLAVSRPTADDWPGPFGFDGTGRSGRDRLPRELSLSLQPSWQIALPGTAQGSPCVWGELVVVPVVDPIRGSLALSAVNRRDGQRVWQTELRRSLRIDPEKLLGMATPACDGQSIFLGAVADGRLLLFAVDLQGRLRWERDAGPMHCETGRIVSPVLHESLVIVSGEHRGPSWNRWSSTSHLTAVHRLTGEILWRIGRPNRDSLALPALAEVAGGKQLILPSPHEISAYDPANGARLWTCRWSAGRIANSIAWNENTVFAMSRDPQPVMIAIRADGSGDVTNSHVLWQSSAAGSSVLTPLRFQDSVLALHENGLLISLEAGTGKTQWRRQLSGTFLMQPILADGELWCLNTAGKAMLVDLHQRGKTVAEQLLPAGVCASPAATRRQLILRTKTDLFSLPWDDADLPLVNTPAGPTNRL